MKNYIFLLLVFMAGIQSVSGQITANKTSGCAPLTGVVFTSPVAGNWDFGNGTSAINVTGGTTIYADPGTYTVSFDDGSGAITETITVFGNPSPEFAIDGPNSGCVAFSTSFGDSSTAQGSSNIVGWQWAFGDGAASTQQNPNHTYSITGTYTVSLIVTDNNGCDSTAVKTDYVSVSNAPTASFSASPTTSCTAPLTVALNNNSTNSTGGTTDLTYEWDFGDGQTSTSANPGSHVYTTTGDFDLTLTISEAGGCSRSQTRSVNIGNPVAGITIADTICIGVNTQYFSNSTGGNSYSWTFDDGGSSSQQNPFHIFNTGGDHDVTLIISAGACSDTVIKTVFVQDLQPTISATPTYQCAEPYCVQFTGGGDNIVNWAYTFGDGNGSNEQNPEHCYTFGGDEYTVHFYNGYNYSATLTGYSIHGCSASISTGDTIFPISANFAPNITQGCAPLTVNFEDSSATGSAIVSYSFDFGDGNSAATENATHTFTTAGEYDVVLTIENANGCRDTSFPIQVLVGEPIDVDLNVSPSTVCIGDTVVITDATGDARIDGYHFSTDENRGSEACPGDSIQQWSFFHETGQHDITFFADYNGCISEELFANAVTVNGPSSHFKWSGNCANPTDIEFIATTSDVDSIYWYFGDGDTLFSDDLNDTIITHSYDTSGDYTVTLISTNSSTGCSNDTNVMVVNVRMLEAIIDVDTLICSGAFFPSGANSVDVDGDCNNAYRWDFGDGSNMYLSNDPSWPTALTDTGTYTIRLMVYDINGCRDTTEQEITITDIYAGFTADTTTGCLPLTINFTDTSQSVTKLTSWSWEYGDGAFGTGETSSHTYTTVVASDYDVLLIVGDSLGCTDTATMTITPIIPDSNFTVNDRTICVGDEVTFTLSNEASMGAATWDFGGQGNSNDLNPTFQFDTAGNYSINVVLTDTNGCPAQRTRTTYVQVDDYPIAGFSTSVDGQSVICYPEQVSFTDTSVLGGVTTFGSRTWNLGVSSPIVASETVSWNYNEPGDYYVSLIESSSNGCRDTVYDTITIVGPVANFTLSETLICVGDEITFDMTDSSDVFAYLWGFGDGTGTDTTFTSDVSSAEITHRYTEVPNGGSTKAQLVIWSKDYACDYTVEKTINVHNVEANFAFEDSTVCLDQNVVFIDSSLTTGSTTYFWDIGNGTTYTSSEPFPQTYQSVGPGTYDVTLIVDDPVTGCKDTLEKELIIHDLPVVLSNDTVMCDGDSTLLIASGADEYSWDNTSGSVWTPDSAATNVDPTTSGTFEVTGTKFMIIGEDTSRCQNTSISTVTVYGESEQEDKDTCAIIGQSFSIGRNYGEGFTYDWNEGTTEFLVCTDCATQTLRITEEVDSITYEVAVSDPLNCFPMVNTYTVCIIDNYTVDVPSAFTPDGTGENNIVYVNGHGIEELLYFRIYNRWGELVFESTDLNVGWDGTYKGNAQDMETFVYQAKVRFLNGSFEEKGGEITLIR